MKIILALEIDQKIENTFEFDSEVIRLGRDPSCDLCLDSDKNPMVSRRHAEIKRKSDNWFLSDVGSTFGTFVDGERLTGSQMLRKGARIQLGTDGPVVLVSDIVAAVEGIGLRASFDAESQSGAGAGSGLATLEIVEGGVGRVEVGATPVTIGRDPNCSLAVEGASTVSRKHAEVKWVGDRLILCDCASFNGTLLNGARIYGPSILSDGDVITLGLNGPKVLLKATGYISAPSAAASLDYSDSMTMMVAPGPVGSVGGSSQGGEVIRRLELTEGKSVVVGRAADCDVVLDGLQISNRHARLSNHAGIILVEDLDSTNGVFLSGKRISKARLGSEDFVQIGPFVLRAQGGEGLLVLDTRAKTRIDVIGITKDVQERTGRGTVRLLDGVSISLSPNEFVGLLGPSGAGKSTLMDALNGMRPASEGRVLMNGVDLYENLEALKQSIGYVPQDDIIHRELTVEETLRFVADLRLSEDVSAEETSRIIEEVLDVTGLVERRHVSIGDLSGGQRKRVSIAVELITKPSVIFLDEPTSGLDPATEDKIMRLFRQIAESGRTVILTTHAMENVKLFDKVVVMMKGKLVFFGRPEEALRHLEADSFQDLFEKLERPIAERLKSGGDHGEVSDQVAEVWRKKYTSSPHYFDHVSQPLKHADSASTVVVPPRRGLGVSGSLRQFFTLTRRYCRVLAKDRLNLLILFAQAPIISVMTFLVMGGDLPRDFLFFVLALVSIWFGTSIAAREIIREKAVYLRERMVNLGLVPYVASKVLVLFGLVAAQCALVWLPLKMLDVAGLISMPGELFGLPHLLIMSLTALVGVALGLLISALVKTSEMATSLVPLLLIPQILFSGLVGVPSGLTKVISLGMPAAWSFDAMKRASKLDTLESEGSSDGEGLYRRIEMENERVFEDAQSKLEESRREFEQSIDPMASAQAGGQGAVGMPRLGEAPALGKVSKVPQDLSGFVTFKHPWMGNFVNSVVLLLMFGLLVIAIISVLKLKDIG